MRRFHTTLIEHFQNSIKSFRLSLVTCHPERLPGFRQGSEESSLLMRFFIPVPRNSE